MSDFVVCEGCWSKRTTVVDDAGVTWKGAIYMNHPNQPISAKNGKRSGSAYVGWLKHGTTYSVNCGLEERSGTSSQVWF